MAHPERFVLIFMLLILVTALNVSFSGDARSQPTSGELFTGVWEGTDPPDGSEVVISLVPTGSGNYSARFTDSHSNEIHPGLDGPGTFRLTSSREGEFVFSLARPDGATVELGGVGRLNSAGDRLTLSAFTAGGVPINEPDIVLERIGAPIRVIHHANVITMNPTQPRAEALALHGDRILAVGSNSEILPLASTDGLSLDANGRTIVPGFIDSHAHWIGDRNLGEIGDVDEVIQLAIEQGWTSINELFVDQARLDELLALDRSDRLRLRVNAYLPINFMDGKFGTWYLAHPPKSYPSERVRIAGIKLFMDHGWGTNIHWSEEELREYLSTAHDAGYQIASHTVGADSHRILFDVLEDVIGDVNGVLHRTRIEHAIVLPDAELIRMRELGLIASAQLNGPQDWPYDETFYEIIPAEDRPLVARWRDIIDEGIPFIGSSDWPWSALPSGRTWTGNPIQLVYQGATRRTTFNEPPDAWMADQAITVEEALESLTSTAAFGTFEEHAKGSLQTNRWADLVILSGDPTTTPVDQLLQIDVLLTLIGGGVEYCAPVEVLLCLDAELFDGSLN